MIHASDLKNCPINKKFEFKTIRVDISKLFKPLTIKFSHFRGEFIAYLSTKKSQQEPCDEHGYELKATDKNEI